MFRGLGFRIVGFWGLGFRVQGLGFRGLGFRIAGLGFKVHGSGFRVEGKAKASGVPTCLACGRILTISVPTRNNLFHWLGKFCGELSF